VEDLQSRHQTALALSAPFTWFPPLHVRSLPLWRRRTPSAEWAEVEDPVNYRPVSLTSILGKMMEQLILEVIIKQVEEKKVIRSS